MITNEEVVEKLRKAMGENVREDVEEWVATLTEVQKATLLHDADVYVAREAMIKERKAERLEQFYRGDCTDPSSDIWEEAIGRAHKEVYGADF